jgi:hypothetical protein
VRELRREPSRADELYASADPADWVNGNLGSSKARYFEGDSVPCRLRLSNLSLGSHKVTIEWDTTQGGKHALDYLTSFNRTVAADPCAGVSGCGSPSTFPTTAARSPPPTSP